MEIEKTEIERLIRDAKNHGRWVIANKDIAFNTPTSFDFKSCQNLIEKVKTFKDSII